MYGCTIERNRRCRYQLPLSRHGSRGKKVDRGNPHSQGSRKGALLLNEGQISHNIVFVEEKACCANSIIKTVKDVTEHFSYEGCIIICIEVP